MSQEKFSECPFNHRECNNKCALYIDVEELNEFMGARLASLGVVDKKYGGTCSLKTLAMSAGRYIFEHTTTKRL